MVEQNRTIDKPQWQLHQYLFMTTITRRTEYSSLLFARRLQMSKWQSICMMLGRDSAIWCTNSVKASNQWEEEEMFTFGRVDCKQIAKMCVLFRFYSIAAITSTNIISRLWQTCCRYATAAEAQVRYTHRS